MRFLHLLLLAAGVPLLASAETEPSMPAAADASAPITPLQYQSVFADYVTVKESSQSPDKGWVRANRALLGEVVEAPAPAGQPQSKHEHEGAHQ